MAKVSLNIKKLGYNYSSEGNNTLQKVFLPLLTCFQLLGIEILNLGPRKVWFVISKVPKYIVLILLVVNVFYEICFFLVYSELKVLLTNLLSTIFTCFTYISLHNHRHHLQVLLRRLSKLYKKVHSQDGLKKIRRIVYLEWFLFTLTIVVEGISCFMLMEESGVVTPINEEDPIKYEIPFSTTFKFLQAVRERVAYLLLFTISAFYSNLCGLIVYCFREIKSAVKRSAHLEMESKALIELHQEATDIVVFMDEIFAFSIFFVIVNNTTGLFWSGYTYAFVPQLSYNEISNCITMALSNSLVILRMTAAASTLGDSALRSQKVVMSLLGFFPAQHHELKVLLEKNQNRNIRLTMWKMFEMKRSLFLSIIGSLLTYGILIGTLGNVQGNSVDATTQTPKVV